MSWNRTQHAHAARDKPGRRQRKSTTANESQALGQKWAAYIYIYIYIYIYVCVCVCVVFI